MEDQEFSYFSVKNNENKDPSEIRLQYAKAKCNYTVLKEKIGKASVVYKKRYVISSKFYSGMKKLLKRGRK